MADELTNILDATGKVLEMAPELYSDVAQPTTKEFGKVLSIIPRAINAALVPARKWIATQEYNLAETEALLAKKLANVDADKIVPPESYVAVPALQAISYSMDSDELRELYANLLSKSMYIETKDYVLPAFTEIIKQLSPLDAQIFKFITHRQINPVVDLKLTFKNETNYLPFFENLSDITINSAEAISVSISNLQRLNLIHIPSGQSYTNEKVYDPIFKTKFFIEQESKYANSTKFNLDFTKKAIFQTSLGSSFFDICVNSL